MRRLILLLICSSLIPHPSSLLFSDALTDKVDKLFVPWNKPDSPGCSLGVIKDGTFVYRRGYGMANLEHNFPLDSQSVFDIGSTSKQFTAMSILLLARQGKLSLDDPIRKYLPEFPESQAAVTIRHLVHHTSGIRDYLTLARLAGKTDDDFYTDDDVVRLLARQKELNFKPGDEHLYSNSGYFLLSQIVKKASGKSLREFAEENIFRPLGMTGTHFHDDHTMIVKHRATGYSPKPGGGFRIEMSTLDMVGDGGIYTSVDGLLLWDRNFYQNKLGGEDLLRQMQTPGALNNGEKLEYASGLHVSNYKGLRTVGHGGSWAGFRAEMLRFPEQRFSVICLCNLSNTNPTRLARQVADIYLAGQLRPEPEKNREFIELPLAQLRAKTGAYREAAAGSIREIFVKDGKLMVGPPANFQIAPVTETRFRPVHVPFTVDFVFEKNQLRIEPEGQKPMLFERVKLVSPSVAQLKEYAGEYHSEELETTYRLALEEAKLFFKQKNAPQRPLEPTVADEFRAGGIVVRFTRDENKKISGLNVNAGRVKNIHFVRK